MKHALLILLITILGSHVWAQAPDMFSYQAVIRDGTNNLVSNTAIGVQARILQGGPSGIEVYSETHAGMTNLNGLITLEIGNGTTASGAFGNIDWGDGPYFIELGTDITGGSNYSLIGSVQLLSVPYALYAETARNVDSLRVFAPCTNTNVNIGTSSVLVASVSINSTDFNELRTLSFEFDRPVCNLYSVGPPGGNCSVSASTYGLCGYNQYQASGDFVEYRIIVDGAIVFSSNIFGTCSIVELSNINTYYPNGCTVEVDYNYQRTALPMGVVGACSNNAFVTIDVVGDLPAEGIVFSNN